MRMANLDDRLVLVDDGGARDVERVSEGRFGWRVADVYGRWDEFAQWAASVPTGPTDPIDLSLLGSPSPRPRQVVAFGLNYREHAAESGIDEPAGLPPVFTKFVSAITGPNAAVALPDGNVDWEVELALVIGRTSHRIDERTAWDHVAGVTVAQDLSERVLQMSGPAPQFSLGKSHPGFLPLGPVLVSPDEFDDPDALHLRASVNGETVQDGNTEDLIMPVPQLLARLTQVITLYPGDVILTGTPSGVGMGRTPARYLTDGDVLVSSIEGIGTMRQTFHRPG